MTLRQCSMASGRRRVRCAVYTRKSTEEGLEQDFNSLDAQREACEAYVASQKAEGWYNPSRRHSALGYKSPINYARTAAEGLDSLSP